MGQDAHIGLNCDWRKIDPRNQQSTVIDYERLIRTSVDPINQPTHISANAVFEENYSCQIRSTSGIIYQRTFATRIGKWLSYELQLQDCMPKCTARARNVSGRRTRAQQTLANAGGSANHQLMNPWTSITSLDRGLVADQCS